MMHRVRSALATCAARLGGESGAASLGRWYLGNAQIRFVTGHSPLARKIIAFNMTAILVMVVGVLYLNPFRDSLVLQRENAMRREIQLIADLVEARLPPGLPATDTAAMAGAIRDVHLSSGATLYAFDTEGNLLASSAMTGTPDLVRDARTPLITEALSALWRLIAANSPGETPGYNTRAIADTLAQQALTGGMASTTSRNDTGAVIFSVARRMERAGEKVGVLALTSAAGEIDELLQLEREQVLQMFVVSIIVSIGLSLVLASAIATPLADLARAAESGRERNSRQLVPARVRIPDMTSRPDEIGRLSGAMRGMVNALYDRLDANEQFAADVAHEIKNPLASLRSAVASLQVVTREDHRKRLLEIIDNDVIRLDRLVSDISNASRLDSELVKEEEEAFDLTRMISGLSDYFGELAAEKGVRILADLPADPIRITGIESRLAQVFVNLIGNALSFCEKGDAVRIWTRRRGPRVLIVVEDTGPGIPEEALSRIFRRFYSQRPEGQFGDHSGLGLAISRQIVEAHGGVIWAENIRPTDADVTSAPMGARFVVGLPCE